MSRLIYQLGETLRSLRRNLAMATSVVLVSFISLGFVGTAGLMQLQVNSMTEDFYDQLEISVFLCTETSTEAACPSGAITDTQRGSIEEMLTDGVASRYVSSWRYESQEEALENFQEAREGSVRAENATVADMPESFRILLQDPEQFEVVNELFGSIAGVETVADQQEVLDQIFGILNGMTLIALLIATVMIVCTVLLVSTTIRLSAMSRRRETSIMRMVGASSSMIRTPFVLEGIIAALIGALLACGSVWVVAEFVMGGWLSEQINGIVFLTGADARILMPFLIVIAVILAWSASWVTVRKYLQV